MSLTLVLVALYCIAGGYAAGNENGGRDFFSHNEPWYSSAAMALLCFCFWWLAMAVDFIIYLWHVCSRKTGSSKD